MNRHNFSVHISGQYTIRNHRKQHFLPFMLYHINIIGSCCQYIL